MYRFAAGVKPQYLPHAIDHPWGKVTEATWIIDKLTENQVNELLRAWGLSSFRWVNISEN